MDTLVLSIDEAYEELQKSQKDELIEKARPHKYIKREGVAGKYQYTYKMDIKEAIKKVEGQGKKEEDSEEIGGIKFVKPKSKSERTLAREFQFGSGETNKSILLEEPFEKGIFSRVRSFISGKGRGKDKKKRRSRQMGGVNPFTGKPHQKF